MRRKVLLFTVAIIFCAYAVFLMPLPYMQGLWKTHTARDRMVASIANKIVGLPKEEIVLLLGKPDRDGNGPNAPDRWLYYVLGQSGVETNVLVIYLDENRIAVDCQTMRD